MKPIQSIYKNLRVICACGNTFETKSTFLQDILNIEVCPKCHSFYTKDKNTTIIAGRADKFKNKFGDLSKI